MTSWFPRSLWTVLLAITTVRVKAHPCSVCVCRLSPERVFCDDLGLMKIPEDIPVSTKVLRIHGNNISTLGPGQFLDFPAMLDLDLSENLIQGVQDRSFSGLNGLRTLNLRGNRIVFVTWNTFTGLANLRELQLGRNPIMCLGTNTFAYLPLLESLDLGELFHLHAISKGAFSRLSRLLYLNISGSNLTGVPFLGYLHSLEELDISHNAIKAITGNDFQSVSTLRKLLLSNNGLSAIEKYAFDALKFVYKLDLSDNSLRGLHRGMFKRMDSLAKVNLKRNPWKCTCKLAWLAKWLRDHIHNESQRVCGACKYPKTLRGQYLCSVPLGNLTCEATPTGSASGSSNVTSDAEDKSRCIQGRVPSSNAGSANGTTVVKGSFRVRVALSRHGQQGSDPNGSDSVPVVYRCPTENSAEAEEFTRISGIILPVTPTRKALGTDTLPEDFDVKMCAKMFGLSIDATKGSPIQGDETMPDVFEHDHVDTTKSYSAPTTNSDYASQDEQRTSRNTEYIVGATVCFIVLGILIWGSFFLHIRCKRKKIRLFKSRRCKTASCCCNLSGRQGKVDEENQVEIPDVNVPEVHSDETFTVLKSTEKPDLYTLPSVKISSPNLYVISGAQDVTYL
ncbi:leucine-rich repeat-containing protein 4B-like [Branchiostoma floridae]|uniref:Leucine-rich repeat-containing protein 4B-like n=1 Tax=Branchiostoma floridae TaxID=7739 RepID=A0A9J7LSL6_BRAFL|nr:leucine-rich repeat-containing protein 4B-like [Branchiostoma floridae]